MSRLQTPVPSSRPQSITVCLVISPLTESLCRNTGPLKTQCYTQSPPFPEAERASVLRRCQPRGHEGPLWVGSSRASLIKYFYRFCSHHSCRFIFHSKAHLSHHPHSPLSVTPLLLLLHGRLRRRWRRFGCWRHNWSLGLHPQADRREEAVPIRGQPQCWPTWRYPYLAGPELHRLSSLVAVAPAFSGRDHEPLSVPRPPKVRDARGICNLRRDRREGARSRPAAERESR